MVSAHDDQGAAYADGEIASDDADAVGFEGGSLGGCRRYYADCAEGACQ